MSLRHLLWVGGFPELSHLLVLLSSQVLSADLLLGLGKEMSPHPQLPSVARLQVVGKRQASVTCFCWLAVVRCYWVRVVLWADLLFGPGEEMSLPELPSVARLQVVGEGQASVTCFY